MTLYDRYYAPASVEEALTLLAQYGERARIIAGGTDLIVELDRGLRDLDAIVDISRMAGLDTIEEHDGVFHLGAGVTHNQIVNDERLIARAFPLVQAAWEVGSPQLRNRGTLAGNLITASPANDTITPLVAMGARVRLRSAARGERTVALDDFYPAFRKVAMQPDEMLVSIEVPALAEGERGAFMKLALRRAQAIAVVNVAVVLRGPHARVTLGCVAPTIVRAPAAEAILGSGAPLTDETIEEAARLASEAAKPIDDVRGTALYRAQAVRVLVRRLLHALQAGEERASFPPRRALLRTEVQAEQPDAQAGSQLPASGPIVATVNGQSVTMEGAAGKTLLRALRENALLVGTKEGCAEGECGACTLWLDGAAVMSCLVPAERARGATLTTIEGLAEGDTLHPVQRAFIDYDAVQCGYCTPGFIMSAAKLLEEKGGDFTDDELKQAISGNLCRCTGYYKIIEAVRAAGNAVA